MEKAFTIVLTVLATLLLTCQEIYVASVITVAPTSVTTSPYTLVNFTCEGRGDILTWTVGGNSLTDPDNQDREISVTTNNISVDVWSSVLTIRALPINDGISIGCTVISFNPFDIEQNGAPLTIKGISHVNCLHLDFTKFVSLTWSPPSFYSDDIPQGSITTYHVIVKSKDGSIIVDDNTTDTIYQLPSNLIVCNIYTASVTAFISQYSSLVIATTEQYTGNYTIDILHHVVEFEKSGNSSIAVVQFIIKIISFPHLCNSIIYSVIKDNVINETTTYHHVYIKNVTDVNETTIYYDITGLHPSLNYTFTAYIMDLFNNTKNEDDIMLSIYNVQGLTLQYYFDNGSVVVECRFAERSTANGCHVIFRESSKGTVKSINITKSSIEESTVYQYISLPVSGNSPNWILLLFICGMVGLLSIMTVLVIIIGLCCYLVKKKTEDLKIVMEKGIEHNPQVDYNNYEELDVVQMRHATITFYNDKTEYNKMSSTDSIKENSHEVEELSHVSLDQKTMDLPSSPDSNSVTASPVASKIDKTIDPELNEDQCQELSYISVLSESQLVCTTNSSNKREEYSKMVTDALKTIQSSSPMEYISESTDVYNNSDRVQEISGINSKSDQSQMEPGSITDDIKRVQPKSSSSRLSDMVPESTNDMSPKDVKPLPPDTFELKDSVQVIEEESV